MKHNFSGNILFIKIILFKMNYQLTKMNNNKKNLKYNFKAQPYKYLKCLKK